MTFSLKTAVRAIAFVCAISLSSISSAASQFASDVKMKVNFKNEEITSIIESFAKASKKTFVVDPVVRGRISVFAPEPVGLDEAFDLMSTSLALNGFTIVEHETKFVVMAARNAQRAGIPTFTEVPPSKPERYLTWIVTLKHMPVDVANSNLRYFPSKDGEMVPIRETNQLVFTDYASNINRIAAMVKVLDQPVSPDVAHLVKESKARYELAAKERMKKVSGETGVESAKATADSLKAPKVSN